MARRKSALDPGFGERFKRARMALGLKQAELGVIADTTEFTLSRYENEVVPPDRCFLAGLEYLTGIQRDWVEQGIEPMVRPPAHSAASSQGLLDRLEDELEGLGGNVKLVPYPVGAGMSGLFPGDLLLLQGGEVPMVEGRHYLVSTPSGVDAGVARNGRNGWLLYHHADKEQPGSFPPTPLASTTGILIRAKVSFVL